MMQPGGKPTPVNTKYGKMLFPAETILPTPNSNALEKTLESLMNAGRFEDIDRVLQAARNIKLNLSHKLSIAKTYLARNQTEVFLF
jgi:hypothetical protein